jgi:rhodanese-related sulfurtransferase
MFMGGIDRRFSTGSSPIATVIGIHGGADPITRNLAPAANSQIYAFYKRSIGKNFKSNIFNDALYRISDANGMLRVREFERNNESARIPWFCPSGTTPQQACIQHRGEDAYGMGIITSKETENLEIPIALKKIFYYENIFNQQIKGTTDSSINQVIQENCESNTSCISKNHNDFMNWLTRDIHRAVAFGIGFQFSGWSSGLTDPFMAARVALFRCNHSGGFSRLCRIVAIDDFLAPDLHTKSSAESLKIIDRIRENLGKLQLNEESSPGSADVEKMKQGNLVGLTPKSLRGIKTIDTKQLLQSLSSSPPPIIIDVGRPRKEMLPFAVHALFGGLAFSDINIDQQFDIRFRGIIRAAGVSSERKIIFYGDSDMDWSAANASLRARAAGFENIEWYRGGIDSWIKLGLDTIPKTPSAILY